MFIIYLDDQSLELGTASSNQSNEKDERMAALEARWDKKIHGPLFGDKNGLL